MLFNSLSFMIFFPVVTLVYYLLPFRWRWCWLLAASCFFYMWFKPVYILILLVTILIDYTAGLMIHRYRLQPRKRKGWLIASIVSTLSVLFIFKYQGLFYETNILLPIGLSFHTFQSLSYVIEVYRGNQRPERHFGFYSLYVMFYPQLVTGPIERPQNLLRQLHIPQPFQMQNLARGVMLILFGLFAKMVVADNLAVYVDQIYAQPDQYGSAAIALGLFFYSFQIYCDFFGYSTIALGCAKAMGYDLMDNFRAPFLSASVGEFWRRWHISLSTWFRDYVYIPMGGSRVSKVNVIRNTFVIFLLSGFWHGANWTFIAWGAYHAILFLPLILTGKNRKYTNQVAEGRILPTLKECGQMFLTFFLVVIGWIVFRAESIGMAWEYVCGMSNNSLLSFPWYPTRNTLFLMVFSILLMLAVAWLQRSKAHGLEFGNDSRYRWVRWCIYLIVTLMVFVLQSSKATQFIYFQF